MKFKEYLILEMTKAEAYSILGVTSDENISIIKRKYHKLVSQYHPDKNPGNKEAEEKFKRIQSAWEIITGKYPPSNEPRQTQTRGIPPWQTDPRSSYNDITSNNYSNMNYVKFKIWDEANKNGGITGEYTLYAFDGSFLRHTLIVFGNDNVFNLMGEAMEGWNSTGGNSYKTVAIIVTKPEWGEKVRVIRVKGKNVSNKNIWIDHESFNQNPSNDNSFTQKL